MTDSLQKALEGIQKARETLALEPEAFDYRSRPGIEMSIRKARDSIESLEATYRKEFLANSIGIFLVGDPTKVSEFCALAATSNDGVTADASGLYERIAQHVERTFGPSRRFSTTQERAALQELTEIGLELHVTSFKRPDFGAAVEVPTHEDVVAHVRKVLRAALSDDLNRMYLEKQAAEQGLLASYSGPTAIVYVTNALPDERVGIAANFGKGHVVVDVPPDAEITKEYLKESFRNVGKKIKQKKEK